MYKFQTKSGRKLTTGYSPKDIADLYCFDSFSLEGESVVVETKEVNFKSFEYRDY